MSYDSWKTRSPDDDLGDPYAGPESTRFDEVFCEKPDNGCEWPECECRRKASAVTSQDRA